MSWRHDAIIRLLDRTTERSQRIFKRWERYSDRVRTAGRRHGLDHPRAQAAMWHLKRFEVREDLHRELESLIFNDAFTPEDFGKIGTRGLRELDRAIRREPSVALRESRKKYGFHPPKERKRC